MRYRIEKDSLGELKIPAEVYYGIHTTRSREAFQITKHGLNRQMIKAFAQIKKIFAKTNAEMGLLDKEMMNVISLSCDEILNGRLHGQFVTDVVQGGSGIGMNMNANEVIANRANEMLGIEKGKYDKVHPIHHVNLKQSSGEVVLLAGKIATIQLMKKLMLEAKKLYNALIEKVSEFGYAKDQNFKLANEIKSIANVLDRDMKRIDQAVEKLHEVSIGSSFFETKEQVEVTYIKKYIKNLVLLSGEDFFQTKEIMDISRNLDGFMETSSALKSLAVNLGKSANDLRLMSDERRVRLSAVQEVAYDEKFQGTISLEVVNQIAIYIVGNDLTISCGVEASTYERNYYIPMIYACLFESINLIKRTVRLLREQVIDSMELVVEQE